MLLSEVHSFGQALNKVESTHAQKRFNFAAKSTDTELPNIVNCGLEPNHMRRMDSAEKENDVVTMRVIGSQRRIIWRILTTNRNCLHTP